ncbi:MAG: aldehyde dehydrogenase [Candidatus Diapherotrites archaeon]|nr:aldehyde dehydrogenase [Candidatus Diapherotrites archaeon]
MVKVGLNGFGRIGRLVLRQGIKSKKLDFVAVNSAAGGKGAAHLFKYDSVYGKFKGKVEAFEDHFFADGKKIAVFSERSLENINWKKFVVEIVKFGIKRAFVTTVHAYTSDQNLLDNRHKDLRRARAAPLNIIPTTTGAKEAAAKILPKLKGKVDGLAIRVPVSCGSLTDIVAELGNNTTIEEINAEMKKASETYLKGILEYTEEPIVSSDVIGNLHSSVFDSLSTAVIGGSLVKVLAWYDNELAYAQRVVELAEKLS